MLFDQDVYIDEAAAMHEFVEESSAFKWSEAAEATLEISSGEDDDDDTQLNTQDER